LDERLFARLAILLAAEPVVLASVLDTRGATPRKGGSRMLITASDSEFSIGGGLAEARVIEAARALISSSAAIPVRTRSRFSAAPSRWRVRSGERRTHSADMNLDLTGRDGAVGICGGSMRLHLALWQGGGDRQRASKLANALKAGQRMPFQVVDDDAASLQWLLPNPRLLILGGGHCGAALYDLAAYLDFDLWVHDTRAECFAGGRFAVATQIVGEVDQIARATKSERSLYVALVNRDFLSDVAALKVLCGNKFSYLGMMGSAKRIHEVLAAEPDLAQPTHAPIGMDIDAHTPHEIAVSILAEIVSVRRRLADMA